MKKFISIICLMAVFVGYIFETEAKPLQTKTKQMETVLALGIMNDNQDDEEDLTENITRADFAEIVYKILYYNEDITGATKSYYEDVSIYHYAAPYIQTLSERGIVYGCGDGNFHPSKIITVEEAVAVILRAIGYDFRLNSGESTAAIASDVGIGKGLSFSAELTRENAAKIIYDTLYANAMVSYVLSNRTKSSNIVLYDFLGLKYGEGVVDGIDGRSLYDKEVRNNTVSINGNVYDIACKIDDDLLGMHVRYYYSEKDEEVRAVVPKNNTILVIDANIETIDNNSDNTKIIYYTQGDKRKTARIDKKADILYNGYVINSISDHIPQNGDIKLIDRNNDGYYDTVFITEYTSYLVSRASEHDEIIAFYNTNSELNLKNYDEIEIVDKNGERLELNSITTNSIISVFDGGKKHLKIVKSDDVINGTITSFYSLDNGKTEVKLEDNIITLCSNCYLGGMTLSAGAKVNIYLDAFGLGVAVKTESKDEWEFGYIVSVWEDRRNDALELKMLTTSGEIETLYMVDKIRIDESKIRITDALTYLNNIFNNFDDEIVGGETHKKELATTRLVRFMRNENTISRMDTPVRYGLYEKTAKPTMSQNDRLLLRVKGNMYRPESKRGFKAVYPEYIDLQGELFYSEKTPIFIVPTEENTDADEDDYGVVTGKDFYSSDGEYIYISSYYTDINSFTPIAIVARKDTFKSGDKRLLIVNKISSVWDEKEGEVLTQIDGYINGKLMAMCVDEKNSDIPISSIKKGDCIVYTMYNEKLRLSQLIYRNGGGGVLNSSSRWPSGVLFNAKFRAIIGHAGYIDGNYMHLQIDSTSMVDEIVALPGSIAFYDSSVSKDAVYMGDYADISSNDIVIVSSRLGTQQDVIVIK